MKPLHIRAAEVVRERAGWGSFGTVAYQVALALRADREVPPTRAELVAAAVALRKAERAGLVRRAHPEITFTRRCANSRRIAKIVGWVPADAPEEA